MHLVLISTEARFGGRCSEYFSEDPYLAGIMAGAEIRGCQEKGVICMVKHFAANEQETHRSIGGDLSGLQNSLFVKSI
ncbi:MAG: glycoside hydrolase family 3 N-terminal domain-containing protein [Ruminococcus sp.]